LPTKVLWANNEPTAVVPKYTESAKVVSRVRLPADCIVNGILDAVLIEPMPLAKYIELPVPALAILSTLPLARLYAWLRFKTLLASVQVPDVAVHILEMSTTEPVTDRVEELLKLAVNDRLTESTLLEVVTLAAPVNVPV